MRLRYHDGVSTDDTFATRNDPLLVKTADGCPLPLRRFGSREEDAAPALLLLAGGDGAMRGWRALLPGLCLDETERTLFAPLAPPDPFDTSLQVVVWDARGGGWAGRGHGVAAPGPAAADALRIAHGLFDRPVHLVGHALGGVTAALAALEAPEAIASLTLISVPFSARGVAAEALAPRDRAQTVRGLSTGWAERHGDVLAALVAEAEVAAAWGGELDAGLGPACEAARAGFDLKDLVGGLSPPVLVVHGCHDAVVPVSHAHDLARAVGAGARLLELDGGHLLPVEQAPGLAAAIEAHALDAETRLRGD